MAREIYSYTKIEKNRTKKGIYASIIGGMSILMLLILIIISFFSQGSLSIYVTSLGYVSFTAGIIGYVMAERIKKNDDIYGKFIKAGVNINAIAIVLHLIVILIGLSSIIM